MSISRKPYSNHCSTFSIALRFSSPPTNTTYVSKTHLHRPGGGGGGTQVQRGVTPALCISRKKGSFLRPPHVRDFVKEGYFFVPRYEVWGLKIPLQSTKYTRLLRRVSAEVTGLPSLLPLNRPRIITSNIKMCVPVHPMSVF